MLYNGQLKLFNLARGATNQHFSVQERQMYARGYGCVARPLPCSAFTILLPDKCMKTPSPRLVWG